MRIALVDNDLTALTTLTEMITSYLPFLKIDNYQIDTFRSGEEFLTCWKSGKYSLIILDIFMKSIHGIDVAYKIRETDYDVSLVFCSSSNSFAAESYDVMAHYYLCKPITEQQVIKMLDRLNLKNMELIRSVHLPDGQTIILRNILYAQQFGHTAQIHLKDDSVVTSRISFTELESLLCEYSYFCCCSKGIIVNFYEIAMHRADVFILSNNDMVPISRRKEKSVQDAYTNFKFNQLRKDMQL